MIMVLTPQVTPLKMPLLALSWGFLIRGNNMKFNIKYYSTTLKELKDYSFNSFLFFIFSIVLHLNHKKLII